GHVGRAQRGRRHLRCPGPPQHDRPACLRGRLRTPPARLRLLLRGHLPAGARSGHGPAVAGPGLRRAPVGGNHARIEAPYILHSEQTGYYYLLLTFGGLDADGGYNILVARSRDVAGPYLDPMGQDLREARSDPELPLFDD